MFAEKTTDVNYVLDKFKFIKNEGIDNLIKKLYVEDIQTFNHSYRVAQYASMITEKLGLSNDKVQMIFECGILHDLGKLMIPQEILSKPSRLTVTELNIIKSHPLYGVQLFSTYVSLDNYVTKTISEGIFFHHERVDGMGYPYNMNYDEIPYIAKILCVADSFDAMTSDRPYKKGLNLKDAMQELKQNSNKQFDTNIVNHFIDIIQEKTYLTA